MKKFVYVMIFSFLSVSLVFSATLNAPNNYPKGELGRLVKLGEEIMNKTDTHPLTKDFVGNKLQCTSCHLKGEDDKPGTSNTIGTFIGTATSFPAFSKREKTVQTLQDRINNCFMRSMNGKRPIIDTEASIAMAAYITWLSTGMPIKMNDKAPVGAINMKLKWIPSFKSFAKMIKKSTHKNYLNGEMIYKNKCADCHGANGEGTEDYTALWGKDKNGKWLSFNTGAGMSKPHKAAAWIKSTMPYGDTGSLSDQEIADVALFMTAQELADFDLQKGLLPREKMGYYNSKVLKEKHSVRSNFKALGLNIDEIRGDKKIK